MLAQAAPIQAGSTTASSGNGTLNHLVTESFKARTGCFIVHIPYRGTGQAMADLMAGQIDLMFDAAITAVPQVKAGKLQRAGRQRRPPAARLPAVPTFDELGLKDFQGNLWIGLLAPAGTPPRCAKVERRVAGGAKRPEVRTRMGRWASSRCPARPRRCRAHAGRAGGLGAASCANGSIKPD
jgi:tripartite-type tricarboxylate transporter receptor subunit TctC